MGIAAVNLATYVTKMAVIAVSYRLCRIRSTVAKEGLLSTGIKALYYIALASTRKQNSLINK